MPRIRGNHHLTFCVGPAQEDWDFHTGLLGLRIPKGAKTTNWSSRTLSPQQITYAATDAWVCRQLYLRFRELELL